MSAALKRNAALHRVGQEYDEMNDFQTQQLQQIARGFTESLKGGTRY